MRTHHFESTRCFRVSLAAVQVAKQPTNSPIRLIAMMDAWRARGGRQAWAAAQPMAGSPCHKTTTKTAAVAASASHSKHGCTASQVKNKLVALHAPEHCRASPLRRPPQWPSARTAKIMAHAVGSEQKPAGKSMLEWLLAAGSMQGGMLSSQQESAMQHE